MSEKERKKLVARFRAHEVVMWADIDLAADEIERLAAAVEVWKGRAAAYLKIANEKADPSRGLTPTSPDEQGRNG